MKTEEEYDENISDLEQKYENLEQKYFLHICVLVGIIMHLYWANWLLTIPLPIIAYIFAWKLLAKRPFTSNIAEDEQEP